MPNIAELRKKYIKMAKSEGLDVAVTALHNEIGRLEPKLYEGGFNQERHLLIEGMRELSRDLWSMRLEMRDKNQVPLPR